MMQKVTVEVDVPASGVLRIEDLPEGACFSKERRLWIKQEHGYCLALDDFVRYQARPAEQVEWVYAKIKISAE